MDLNGDGQMDILSGSYSRDGQPMAGLFQLLLGSKQGFQAPVAVKGTDDKPLIIPLGDADVVRTICTRPTAVDINGDGHLDIISGNFEGSFWWFKGEGEGKFAPKGMQLMAGKKALSVPAHSDPFLVDWDGDGDFDMLSGSANGGAYLISNTGSAKAPIWNEPTRLVKGVAHGGEKIVFGDAHIKGPQSSTRVWADDLNHDGKMDLLIGDNVSIQFPAKGLKANEVEAKLATWNEEMAKLAKTMEEAFSAEGEAEPDQEMIELWQAHHEKRKEIVRSVSTGYVWVLYQK